MKNKNLKFMLIIGILLALVAGLGASYSFFIYRKTGNNISVESGEISINFVNNTNYISISDAYPVSDETGKIYPYYADFTINAVTADYDINYEIQLVPDASNTIDTSYIKVYLTDQNDNSILGPVDYDSLVDATHNTTGKTVQNGLYTTDTSESYRLRVWIDESYIHNVDESFGFNIYLYAVNSNS